MNKRFLWICIVLMALVLVIGCDDSPNNSSGGSGGSGGSDAATAYAAMSTNQKLVYDFFLTSVPLYTSLTEIDPNLATFLYNLDADYDTTMNAALGFTPQYIHNGTSIDGTLELSGISFNQLNDIDPPPPDNTTVSMTFTATATGPDIPGDNSVTIVYFTSGEYGADEPSTITFTVDGASVTFSDLSFIGN